jgi:hypothetical protein
MSGMKFLGAVVLGVVLGAAGTLVFAHYHYKVGPKAEHGGSPVAGVGGQGGDASRLPSSGVPAPVKFEGDAAKVARDRSKAPAVRLAAAEVAAKAGAPSGVPGAETRELFRDLMGEPDPQVAEFSLATVASWGRAGGADGDAKVVETAIAATQRKEKQVRRNAAMVLAQSSSREAAGRMVELLKDGDPLMRIVSAERLKALGAPVTADQARAGASEQVLAGVKGWLAKYEPKKAGA